MVYGGQYQPELFLTAGALTVSSQGRVQQGYGGVGPEMSTPSYRYHSLANVARVFYFRFGAKWSRANRYRELMWLP